MTDAEFSRRRTAYAPSTSLVLLPLEVWDVTKVWMLIENCFADAQMVEELLCRPGTRRRFAMETEAVFDTLYTYRVPVQPEG